jgi:hypothetical protein
MTMGTLLETMQACLGYDNPLRFVGVIWHGHRFLTLTKLLQLWMLMVVVPLLLVVGGMEMALRHGIIWACVLIIVGLALTMETIVKTKTVSKK